MKPTLINLSRAALLGVDRHIRSREHGIFQIEFLKASLTFALHGKHGGIQYPLGHLHDREVAVDIGKCGHLCRDNGHRISPAFEGVKNGSASASGCHGMNLWLEGNVECEADGRPLHTTRLTQDLDAQKRFFSIRMQLPVPLSIERSIAQNRRTIRPPVSFDGKKLRRRTKWTQIISEMTCVTFLFRREGAPADCLGFDACGNKWDEREDCCDGTWRR